MKLIFEPGKFYKTRDGRKVEHLVNTSGKLSGTNTFLFSTPEKFAIWTRENGHVYRDIEYHNDIVSEWKEPLKISGWLNVYPDGSTGSLHPTREEAISWVASDRTITTIFVQGTEGK